MKYLLLCVLSLSSFVFSSDTGFQYFPDSVELIAKWDVSSTLAIDGLNKQLTEGSQDELHKLIALGLNPMEDVEDVFFGLASDKEHEGDESIFLGIVRFNRKINLESIIQSYAKQENIKVEVQEHRGIKLFQIDDEDPIFVSQQVKGEWCVLGSLSLVQQSIDLFKGKGTSIVKNRKLMDSCQDGLLPHLFWATGNLNSAGPGTGYQNVLFTLDYLNGIQIAGHIPFQTVEEKTQITQTLSMGTGLLMMLSQGKMNPADISIEEGENDIRFKVTIPDGMLQSLKAQAEAMSQQGQQPEGQQPE